MERHPEIKKLLPTVESYIELIRDSAYPKSRKETVELFGYTAMFAGKEWKYDLNIIRDHGNYFVSIDQLKEKRIDLKIVIGSLEAESKMVAAAHLRIDLLKLKFREEEPKPDLEILFKKF